MQHTVQSILIIEDDRGIREALVDILELEGYTAFGAEDGLVGVALARKKRPTLIICDITMPHLDGYGVLAELRRYAETATIPFIFLTARTTATEVRQGMNLGADDYLTKPLCAEELLRAVQARIKRQATLADKLQERIDNLQSNLMSVLPHELNTPLHGIVAGIEFLRDEYASLEPADVEELLCIVHQCSVRMRRLVANCLLHAELSHIQAAPAHAEFMDRVPATAVDHYVELGVQQQAAAATRQADIRLQLTDASVRILPNHLSKIVEEIINNALQYSDSGTPVEIVCHCTDGHFCLTVTDHGRGMSHDEIAAISAFRQFQRILYEQQGLGLGLSIVQRLVELYRGQLVIESVPHQHTTVQVKLPLAAPMRHQVKKRAMRGRVAAKPGS